MTTDEMQLLRDFGGEVPAFDEETKRRAYVHATQTPRHGLRRRSAVGLTPSRRLLVGLAAIFVVGAGSAIAAVTVMSRGSPLQLSPTEGQTPSLGSDSSSIIAAIKSRVPNVSSIQISNEAVSNASGTSTQGYLIAHIEVAAPADSGAEIARAMWEANLVGGALRTAFTQAGLTPPYGTDLTMDLPDGSNDHIGGGVGNVVPNQVFDTVTPALQSTVTQNAATEGFTNVRVSTFQVINDVMQIHATATTAPAAAAQSFLKAGGLDGLLGESQNDFESVYFEIDDAAGNPLLIRAANPRAGAGVFWADPSTGLQPDIPNGSS